jgi:uncharacterized membrane protein YoaK (UPF0700 family)
LLLTTGLQERVCERRTANDQRLSTNDDFRRTAVQEELHHARSLGLSVALGAAMGAALGAVTGHVGIWVAAGIAAYVVISLVGGAWSNKRNDTTNN